MKLKTTLAFFFLCASSLLVTTSTAQAQEYGFRFFTIAPGFSGELFFNAPAGSGSPYQVPLGDSFITTPDGTFTLSKSVIGGPLLENPPPIVWSPAGITALNLSRYQSMGTQLYDWTATPNTIGDAPVSAIPLVLTPSASGTWVYVGVVPEPGVLPLTILGVLAMLTRLPFRVRSKPFHGL